MSFVRSCYVVGRDRGLEFFRSAMEEYPLGGVVPCETEDGQFEEGDEVTPQYWVSVAYEGESNNRQFSPWELVANAINSFEDSSEDEEVYDEDSSEDEEVYDEGWEAYDEGWEAYDGGISQGIAIGLWLYERGSQVPCRCIYGIPTE